MHPGLATLAASIVTSLAALLPAEAQERKPSNCFALAQTAPQSLLRKAAFSDTVAADHLRIHYLNHAEFALTAGDITAVTDFTGLTGDPDFIPDVVTMNNAHDSHWTAAPDPRIPHVLRGWPQEGRAASYELDLGPMLVRNVTTDTRGPFGEGALRDGNSIFVFEAAGLCVGHLGHLHQIPDDAQYAAIGRLDVVMVPVDGGYTMSTDAMVEVVSRLRARVIIPMHWFSGASLETFLSRIGTRYPVVETGGPELILSQDDLPATPTVLILSPELLRP